MRLFPWYLFLGGLWLAHRHVTGFCVLIPCPAASLNTNSFWWRTGVFETHWDLGCQEVPACFPLLGQQSSKYICAVLLTLLGSWTADLTCRNPWGSRESHVLCVPSTQSTTVLPARHLCPDHTECWVSAVNTHHCASLFTLYLHKIW